MALLLGSAVFFLLIHLLVSGTSLRRQIVAGLGEGPFRAVFALLSIASIITMGFGFSRAGPGAELYDLKRWSWVAMPMTFVAFQLLVMAFMFPNPTSAGGEGYLAPGRSPMAPVGIQRITRHPFLWGVSLWSLAHLIANGSLRGLLLFGTMLATALIGTFAIDAKRRQSFGEQWKAYAAATSNVPFVAILMGRARFSAREIGWWRPLVPTFIFAAFYAAHGTLFGAPLPPAP